MQMKDGLGSDDIKILSTTFRKIDFLASVNVDTIDSVFEKIVLKRFPGGRRIIKENSQGKALFIIKTGSCLVYKREGLFRKKKIAVLKPGDFFGEMSLISDYLTSASVMTIEPTELLVYSRTDFLGLIEKNSDIRQKIEKIADNRRYDTIIRN